MDVGIQGGCILNNQLWFFLAKGNGLCRMNLDTGDIKYIISIPGEAISGTFLYQDIKHYGHQLILIPRNAMEIAVYDMDTKKILKVPVHTEHLKYKDYFRKFGKFHSALVVDEWIYFVPLRFPAIVKMNMKTFEVLYLEDWIRDILPYYRVDRAFFRQDIVSDERGRIYLTSLYYNMVLSVNTKTDQMSIVRNGRIGDGQGCLCITYQNNTFALFELDYHKILLFDYQWKLKQEISCPNIFLEKDKVGYIQSLVWKNYIFYIPFGSNTMLRLDMNTNSLNAVGQRNSNSALRYERAWIWNEKLYCYRDLKIDIFDIEGCLIRSIQVHFQEDLKNDMMMEFFAQNNILEETRMIHLEEFLKFLSRGIGQSDMNDYKFSGNKIYTRILDL